MEHIAFYIGILVILLGVGIVLEIRRETSRFRVTRYQVKSDKMPGGEEGVKLLFLSDLHNWKYGEDNEKLLDAARRESPDLILIGGDMLVGKAGVPYDTALKFVKKLPDICPVFYANGNHEQRMKEDPEQYGTAFLSYKRELLESRVRFLENESCPVTVKGRKINIVGLELPCETYQKFQRAEITAKTVEKLAGEKKEGITILMAHNPAYMDAYLEWGADLILSGHLHGGLIRLPVFGGIVTPQGFLFPKYSGEMTREGNQTVIVSRGLGTHTINIRFLNMPELISVRLGGET